jgi:hypothetical protein
MTDDHASADELAKITRRLSWLERSTPALNSFSSTSPNPGFAAEASEYLQTVIDVVHEPFEIVLHRLAKDGDIDGEPIAHWPRPKRECGDFVAELASAIRASLREREEDVQRFAIFARTNNVRGARMIARRSFTILVDPIECETSRQKWQSEAPAT